MSPKILPLPIAFLDDVYCLCKVIQKSSFMKKEKYIRFAWAMKRMLRDKAHFARRSLVGRQGVEPKGRYA